MQNKILENDKKVEKWQKKKGGNRQKIRKKEKIADPRKNFMPGFDLTSSAL